jgi:hypothetical protein
MPTELYEIRVKGRLRAEWSTWFGGLVITDHPGGETTLTGPITDQSALHGILLKIRDLGLPLLSVNRVESKESQGMD